MTRMATKGTQDTPPSSFEELLKTNDAYTAVPQVGKLVIGTVVNVTSKEVHIDVGGLTTGVVRGHELFEGGRGYKDIKVGDEVEATVLDLENENGEMELSFRFAGQQKLWDRFYVLQKSEEVVPVTILEANKGGLLVELEHMKGFLPVSQLTPEHYPRVPGGDKHKILEKLRSYVGEEFRVKVLDVDQEEEKLIVSEKAAWEEKQKEVLQKFEPGQVVEGTISALADFGAFLAFGEGIEGLIHISEIAWQRVEHPKDIVQVGDNVKAVILKVDGAKIFLSLKRLAANPWDSVKDTYAVGQEVTGKILKSNPYGFFVEVESEIHGLAHISELGKRGTVLDEVAQVGEVRSFTIISLDPAAHRMGLRLVNGAEKAKGKKKEPAAKPEAQEVTGELAEKPEEKAAKKEVKKKKEETSSGKKTAVAKADPET